MRSLLRAARFHTDIPVEITGVRKCAESPYSRRNHAKPAALKQIPVSHTAHLGFRGLHIGLHDFVDHHLRCREVLRRVDGKGSLILAQHAAAVLGRHLKKFVERDGLVNPVNIISERADFLTGRHRVIPCPCGIRVCHACLIEQILVVDQHYVGKVSGHAILLAVYLKGRQCGGIVTAHINARQFRKHPFVRIGCKVLDIQLVAVGRRASRHSCLHLGEIVIVSDGLDVHRNIGVFCMKRLVHFLQSLLIAA